MMGGIAGKHEDELMLIFNAVVTKSYCLFVNIKLKQPSVKPSYFIIISNLNTIHAAKKN